MARIRVDVDGAAGVARDLETVERLMPRFRRVVERGAWNVKQSMSDDARSNGYARHFHRSISYDMTGELSAEIGPDKHRVQGALGVFMYFGRSDTPGVLDLESPLRREIPRFELALIDVAEDVL